MNDEVIRELWAVKDEMAREHGYNIEALAAHIQNKTRWELSDGASGTVAYEIVSDGDGRLFLRGPEDEDGVNERAS